MNLRLIPTLTCNINPGGDNVIRSKIRVIEQANFPLTHCFEAYNRKPRITKTHKLSGLLLIINHNITSCICFGLLIFSHSDILR